MACCFPGAKDYEEFWANLVGGVNSISQVPEERRTWREPASVSSNALKWDGFVTDIDKFDANFFNISAIEAESMDPQQRMMLELSWPCFEDAGIQPERLAGGSAGVYFGMCNYDYKELIEQALKDAGITSETVSYIEAHGTATPLGDPIEVRALTQSSRSKTDKRQYCGIGPVKRNIGHTLTAAGVASVIKVLLCLRQKKIIPSLHVNELSEHVAWEESPFHVNTTLKTWETDSGKKRIAAVSSFGFSGTNANIVIEEAPEQLRVYQWK